MFFQMYIILIYFQEMFNSWQCQCIWYLSTKNFNLLHQLIFHFNIYVILLPYLEILTKKLVFISPVKCQFFKVSLEDINDFCDNLLVFMTDFIVIFIYNNVALCAIYVFLLRINHMY